VRKLTLSLAVMAALLPLRGHSLGLGDLELHSALNQELNAEIEVLSAASEDAEQIIIKLADREAFSRAGLDRPFLLQQLKFKIIDKNGVPYVKVYSKTPIREPFLSFLLEIDWPQGHLLREYTLLLDPPVYNNASGANTNTSFNQPADAQAQTQPVQSQQQNAPTVQTSVISSDSGRSVNYEYQALPVETSPSADQYRVQQNDTLWGIASRMRPDNSISVEQMMLALVRKNPEAFIRENINGVKRGYILRAPSRDEITQLDRQQAVAAAREHSTLWREYSHAAASSSPASAMEADAMDSTGSDEGAAADQPRDVDGQLSIVGAGEGGEQTGSNQAMDAQLSQLKQDLALANEQLESERLEKEDLRNRLAELEQRVKSVIEGGGRVEMSDGELAQLQNDLQSTQQAVEEQAALDVIADTDEVAANDELIEPVADEMLGEDEVSEVDESSETTPAEDVIFADEAAAEKPADEIADTQEAVQQTQPDTVKAVTPPAFAQQQPKSFIEGLMDDPKLLGIIGGGVAFILLLLALLLKRIRGNKAEEDEWTAGMSDPSDASNDTHTDFLGSNDAGLSSDDENNKTVQSEAFGMDQTSEMEATQVQTANEDNLEDTVFNLGDSAAKPEEDERDDVIAEADVYLAYGIYQQAEELLNSAIEQNPDRDDYRMKLLETHYAAKDAAAFEQLATDVKSRKGDDKTYWDRVVAMGMELSPTSALFSGAGNALTDFDANALLPDKLQATDFELDAGDDSGELDLGLDSDLADSDLDDMDLDDMNLDDTDLGDSGLDDDLELTGEDTQIETAPNATDDLDLAGDLEDITNDLDSTDTNVDDDSSELEFDLGEMDDIGVSDTAEDTSTETMDIDDDFSLDFDAADLGFEESEDDAKEISLDADLDLSEDLEDESVEIDLSDDLGDNLDVDLDDTNELDLGDSTDSSTADLDVEASGDDEEFDVSELSEDIDEVGTKLDLARAYIDMGDNEGARSILEEVKAEGNDEQQQLAEELMQQAG